METHQVLKAQLVHAEPGRRVVEVSAWQGERCLGSCLGEADHAETAEERALQRLQQRLAGNRAQAVVRHRPSQEETAPQAAPPAAPAPPPAAAAPQPEPAPEPPVEAGLDPDDWSEELAEIDVQLQRIGWDRNHEGIYLQRVIGHHSRSRITSYAELAGYLRSLRALAHGSDPATAPVPLRRRDLLEQCDQLLQQLHWDAARGRTLLEQEFQLSSRQQLSDEQLLQFNMLLESALLEQQSG